MCRARTTRTCHLHSLTQKWVSHFGRLITQQGGVMAQSPYRRLTPPSRINHTTHWGKALTSSCTTSPHFCYLLGNLWNFTRHTQCKQTRSTLSSVAQLPTNHGWHSNRESATSQKFNLGFLVSLWTRKFHFNLLITFRVLRGVKPTQTDKRWQKHNLGGSVKKQKNMEMEVDLISHFSRI